MLVTLMMLSLLGGITFSHGNFFPDEQEISSGLVYILKSKRLARIVKENIQRREEEIQSGDVDVETTRDGGSIAHHLKSTFHSPGMASDITSVDTSTLVTSVVLHNIPIREAPSPLCLVLGHFIKLDSCCGR